MVSGYLQNSLGANPVQALSLKSGRTAVNLLMLSLACRPVAKMLGLPFLLMIRKTLGLYAFFYAFFHFLVFVSLDFEFNLPWILDEIRYKPFIQIGLVALIMLMPLAITSLQSLQKRMGKIWQALHRIVYLISILVLIHFFLASKGDLSSPVIYGVLLVLLLVLRLPPLNRLKLADQPKWMKSINQFLMG